MPDKQGSTADGQKICRFPQGEIRRITAMSRVSRILVGGNSEGDVKICWNDTALRKTDVFLKDGTLCIMEKSVAAFYGVFGLFELGRQKDVHICLPDGFEGEVVIHSSHEPVQAADVALEGRVEINSGTGMIKLSDVSGPQWVLKSDYGEINAVHLYAATGLQASSVTGNMNFLLDAPQRGYDFCVHTQHGTCIAPVQCKGQIPVRIDSSTGSIRIAINSKK